MVSTAVAAMVMALLVASPAWATDLEVRIVGVQSDEGALMIGLYDSAERFDIALDNAAKVGLLSDKGRLVGAAMRARTGTQGLGFLLLPPGRYAVIVYHDENDNGLLDKDFWGTPKEGYGFGNNATGFFGAPSFAASAVTIADSDQFLTISLIYPSE